MVKVLEIFLYLFVYDDVCYLKKFIMNFIRVEKSEYFKFLIILCIVVDNMYFVNYVDKWCRRNVNLYIDDLFKYINMEVCE